MNSDDIFFLFILCLIIWIPYGLFIGIPYSESKREANNIIKFRSFLVFYQVNPHKWELYDWHVSYKDTSKQDGYYRDFMGRLHYTVYSFRFNRIDFIRYLKWKASKDKIEKRKAQESIHRIQLEQDVREYEAFIECMKRDLEQFKQSKPWEDIK
nr:MAG TPA: cellulose biosynthesis protein [Caudoviricetes sp.]